MAFNILDYTKNVGKSITYSTIDRVKDINPVLKDVIDANAELTKQVTSAVKDYKGSLRRGKEWVIGTQLYEAADVGFHAIAEDIRSGKFYNRERIEEMYEKAGGDLTNWDDVMGGEDPFAEIDSDSESSIDDKEMEQKLSRDTEMTIGALDNVGSKMTNGIATATMMSAQSTNRTNIELAKKGQKHNEFLANKLTAGLGSVNSTIAQLIEFNTTTVHPFIQGTSKWQTDMMTKQTETVELLKQIVANQNKAITPEEEKKDREKITYESLGDTPDMKEYFKLIKKNISDMTMGMGDMFNSDTNGGFGNMLLTFASSPLQGLTNMVAKKIIPKAVENAVEALNEGMEGFFASFIAKMNNMAEDEDGNPLTTNLGKILGLSSAGKVKNKLDVTAIGKKAIAYDEESKQALTRVIPDTLAKILAAQTQTSEKLYDYASGRYLGSDEIREKFDPNRLVQESAERALRDYMEPIKKELDSVIYKSADEKKMTEKALQQLAEFMYRNDKIVTPEMVNRYRREDKIISHDIGLDGINEEVVDLITGVIAGLGDKYFVSGNRHNRTAVNSPKFRRAIQSANKSIFREKSNAIRTMEQYEQAGSVALNTANGYDMDYYNLQNPRTIRKDQDRDTLTSSQKNKVALDPMNDLRYSLLAYQKQITGYLERIDKHLHEVKNGQSIFHVGIDNMPSNNIGGGSNPPGGNGGDMLIRRNIEQVSNRHRIYLPNGQSTYVSNQSASGNGASNSEVAYNPISIYYESGATIEAIRDNETRNEESLERAYESDVQRKLARQAKGGKQRYLNRTEEFARQQAANLAGSDAAAAGQEGEENSVRNVYQDLHAHTIGNAEYRRMIDEIQELKEKDEKKTPIGLFKQIMGLDKEDNKDGKASTFIDGLDLLSKKPAEFLANMIHKVDDRMYEVIFGDNQKDEMAPHSFMNQLTTRMGIVFRDFKGWLRDEIFDPIKSTLFGEDGVLHKATDLAKDKLNIKDGDIFDFIFGKKDENGERHGGMFGDKINYMKSSMKDVYGALGDILVPLDDGTYALNRAGYERALDERNAKDMHDGKETGYTKKEVYEIMQANLDNNADLSQNAQKIRDDFENVYKITLDDDSLEELRSKAVGQIKDEFKDKFDIDEKGNYLFSDNFTEKNFNDLVDQRLASMFVADRSNAYSGIKNQNNYTLREDRNFDKVINYARKIGILDPSTSLDDFENSTQFTNALREASNMTSVVDGQKLSNDEDIRRMAYLYMVQQATPDHDKILKNINGASVYKDLDDMRYKAIDIALKHGYNPAMFSDDIRTSDYFLRNQQAAEMKYGQYSEENMIKDIRKSLENKKNGKADPYFDEVFKNFYSSSQDVMNKNYYASDEELEASKQKLIHLYDINEQITETIKALTDTIEEATTKFSDTLGMSFDDVEKLTSNISEYYKKDAAGNIEFDDKGNHVYTDDRVLEALRLSKTQQFKDIIRSRSELNKQNKRKAVINKAQIRESDFFNGEKFKRGETSVSDMRRNGGLQAGYREGLIDNETATTYKLEGDAKKINQARGTTAVTKTGIAAVSKGEMIIPAKYNPFYHGESSMSQGIKNENRAIDQYLNTLKQNGVPIGKFAEGSLGVNEDGTAELEELKDQHKNGFWRRLLMTSRDRMIDDIHGGDKNLRRKRGWGKLTDQGKETIREYGYDGKYDELSPFLKELYDKGDFAGVLEGLGKLEGGIKAAAEDNAADNYEESKKKLFGSMIDDVKQNFGNLFPGMLGSALIGGGVSLLTGAIGGPLLGAAVGAGLDLATHSEGVKNWLFGELDEKGDRTGNVLSKDIANNIEKYFPDMAKGAVVGGITSILPFVPGGPVTGIILGSAIGFAKNNETIQRTLFGYYDEEHDEYRDGILPKDFMEKLRGHVPDAVLGMLAGGVGGAMLGGPFGLVGNMALGGAINILAHTETFQDKLFGTKDPSTGIRQGGLVGAIKTGFVEPLIESGKTIKDKLVDWFKRDIAHPLASAVRPLAKQGGLLFGGIARGVSRIVGDAIGDDIGKGFSGFSHMLADGMKKVMQSSLSVAQTMAHPVGRMISAPTRMIGNVGERFRKRHVADGDATYMTAKQRMQYRQELDDNVYYKKYDSDVWEDGVLKHRKGDIMTDEMGQPIKEDDRNFKYFHNLLGRGKMKQHGKHKDKFRAFDEMLMEMGVDDLKDVQSSLRYLKDPNQEAQRQRKKSVDKINDTVHTKFGLSYRESKKLLNALREKGMYGAKGAINKLDMNDIDKEHLLNFLTQEYSNYQASDETLAQSKGFRKELEGRLKDMGINIDGKNLDKSLDYINREIKEKEKMDPVDNLREEQKERHQEIKSLFQEAIDNIKGLNDNDYKEKLIAKYADQNKRQAEEKRSILGHTFRGFANAHFGANFSGSNNNALGGKDYNIVPEIDRETGEERWFAVYNGKDPNRQGERYEVDSYGNPLTNDWVKPDFNDDTLARRGLSKAWAGTKKAAKFLDRSFGKAKAAYRDGYRNTVDESIYKNMCHDYLEKAFLTASDDFEGNEHEEYQKYFEYKNEKGLSWEQFWNYITKDVPGNDKANPEITGKKAVDSLNSKNKERFFESQIGRKLGRNANSIHRRLHTGIFNRKNRFSTEEVRNEDGEYFLDENGKKDKSGNLTAEAYWNDHKEMEANGEQGRNIIGEESDVLNKRKTIFDLFGNPIKVKKSKEGSWIKDNSANENKEASHMHNIMLGLGDRFTSGITGLATDIKDGFAHFFNIDTERDGKLKTLLKVGGGILGVLTVAGIMAKKDTWWDQLIKPGLINFYDAHIYPHIKNVIDPVKDTVAKMAIGIDTTIQKIPNAIHALGDRVGGFIKDDLPGIWSTKILPFYQEGYNWLAGNVDKIVAKAIHTTFQIMPAVISGAFKGATQFLTKDIFTLLGGLGRRDAKGLVDSTSIRRTASSGIEALGNMTEPLSSFNGVSKLAGALTHQKIDPGTTPSTRTQSEIISYYTNSDVNQNYPEDSSASTSAFEGYDSFDSINTDDSNDFTPIQFTNKPAFSGPDMGTVQPRQMANYAENLATGSGSDSPTIDSNTRSDIDELYKQNVEVNKELKKTTTEAKANNRTANLMNSTAATAAKLEEAAKAKNTTQPNTKKSTVPGATGNQTEKGKYNSKTAFSKGSVKNYDGVYNTRDLLASGSSAGISTYKAMFDESTGLVYSSQGEFIPNAYYDPLTGNITDTPTQACLDAFPDIEENHNAMLAQALENGDISYEDYYGSEYDPEMDPNYTDGMSLWGMTGANISEGFSNIASLWGDSGSIGGRFTGIGSLGNGKFDTPTGLLRTAITGRSGVVGKGLQKLSGNLAKGGIFKKTVNKAVSPFAKASNFAENHSVASLFKKRNAIASSTRSDALNRIWEESDNLVNSTKSALNKYNSIDDIIAKEKEGLLSRIDAMEASGRDATSLRNRLSELGDIDSIKASAKSSYDDQLEALTKQVNEKLGKEAGEAASEKAANKITASGMKNALGEAVENGVTKGKPGFIKTVTNKIKESISKIFHSGIASKQLADLSSSGISKEAVEKALTGEASEALGKAVGKKCGTKVMAKIAHAIPYVNLVFYAADFITGCKDAPTYLGVSDNQFEEIFTMGERFLIRLVCGIANLINGAVLLGIPPMTMVVDLFLQYVAPLIGMDTTELMEAREETAKELEKYIEETGITDATVEDLDDYNSWWHQWKIKNGWIADEKEEYKKVKAGNIVYNTKLEYGKKYTSGFSSKWSNAETSQSRFNEITAKADAALAAKKSAKGSGLVDSKFNRYYGRGPSDITGLDQYVNIKDSHSRGISMGSYDDVYNYYGSISSSFFNANSDKERQNIIDQVSKDPYFNYVAETYVHPGNKQGSIVDVFQYCKDQYDDYVKNGSTGKSSTINDIYHSFVNNADLSVIPYYGNTQNYVGAGNRFYNPISSLGSIDSFADANIPNNKYIAKGSGLPTVSPSYYVTYMGGASKKKEKNLTKTEEDSIKVQRGNDIVTETARIAMYLESAGNIANVKYDESDKVYKIGCASWKGKNAIKLLQGLLKTKPEAFKKALTDKYYNELMKASNFKKDTFDKDMINRIKRILATEESRKYQLKQITADAKSYCNTIATNVGDPHMVLFLAVTAFRYGVNSKVVTKADTSGDYKKFFTSITTGAKSIYNGDVEYFNQLYSLVSGSAVQSTDTSKADEKSVEAGMGVSSSNTSGSDTKSSGNWIDNLRTAITNLGYATFGINMYKDENGETTDYGAVQDPIKDAEKNVEECLALCTKFNDTITYSLKECFGFLREAFDKDADHTVEQFAYSEKEQTGNLLAFLCNSLWFQENYLNKFATNSNVTSLTGAENNGTSFIESIYGSVKNAWQGDNEAVLNADDQYRLEKSEISTRKDYGKKLYVVDDAYKSAVTAKIDITMIQNILDNADTIATKVFKEFSRLANNIKATESLALARNAGFSYLFAYQADDYAAKGTPYYKMLKNAKKAGTIIKQYYGDRVQFYIQFSKYLNSTDIEDDWNSKAFMSEKDKKMDAFFNSLEILGSNDSLLEEKENAWDVGVATIADMFGIDDTLSNKSFAESLNKEAGGDLKTIFSLDPTKDNTKSDINDITDGYAVFASAINKATNSTNKKGNKKKKKAQKRQELRNYLIETINTSYPSVKDFNALLGVSNYNAGEVKENPHAELLSPFSGLNTSHTNLAEDIAKARSVKSLISKDKKVQEAAKKYSKELRSVSGAQDTNDLLSRYEQFSKVLKSNGSSDVSINTDLNSDSFANLYNPYTLKRVIAENSDNIQLTLKDGHYNLPLAGMGPVGFKEYAKLLHRIGTGYGIMDEIKTPDMDTVSSEVFADNPYKSIEKDIFADTMKHAEEQTERMKDQIDPAMLDAFVDYVQQFNRNTAYSDQDIDYSKFAGTTIEGEELTDQDLIISHGKELFNDIIKGSTFAADSDQGAAGKANFLHYLHPGAVKAGFESLQHQHDNMLKELDKRLKDPDAILDVANFFGIVGDDELTSMRDLEDGNMALRKAQQSTSAHPGNPIYDGARILDGMIGFVKTPISGLVGLFSEDAGKAIKDARFTSLAEEAPLNDTNIFNPESEDYKILHGAMLDQQDLMKNKLSYELFSPSGNTSFDKFKDLINKATSRESNNNGNVDEFYKKHMDPNAPEKENYVKTDDPIAGYFTENAQSMYETFIPQVINKYMVSEFGGYPPVGGPFRMFDDEIKLMMESDGSSFKDDANTESATEDQSSVDATTYFPFYPTYRGKNVDYVMTENRMYNSPIGPLTPEQQAEKDKAEGKEDKAEGKEDSTKTNRVFGPGTTSIQTSRTADPNAEQSTDGSTPTADQAAQEATAKGSKLQKYIEAKGNNFISQLDYAGKKFSDGESYAEAGCGPAVAAMAINNLSGGASMMQTAALADKYKTSGGTSADYFQDVFSRAGAKTTYYEGAKAQSGATKSLKAGQQVVLLGQNASNRSKANSPFGPGNHYVLAKGMSNGKIAVDDPEQHGTKVYDKSILKNTKLSMSVAKGSGIKYNDDSYSKQFRDIVDLAGRGKKKKKKSGSEGAVVFNVPAGCGTKWGYQEQDSLKWAAGKIIKASSVNKEGFRKVNGRYCVSLTPYLASGGKYSYSGSGKTKKYTGQDDNMNGRYFDVYLEGNIRIPCIVCDIKGRDNANGGKSDWGHENGAQLLEFVKNKSIKWKDNPGSRIFINQFPKYKKWGPGKNASFGKKVIKVVVSDTTWFKNSSIGPEQIKGNGVPNAIDDGTSGGDNGSSSSSNGGTWMDDLVNGINKMGKALLGMDDNNNGSSGTVSGDAATIASKDEAARWKLITGGKCSTKAEANKLSESECSALQTTISVPVNLSKGKTGTKKLTCNKYLASLWKSFFEDLAKTGLVITRLGCYCYRKKTSGGSLSSHAFGAAVDINSDAPGMAYGASPLSSAGKNSRSIALNSEAEKVINSYKLDWGGRWNGTKDPMHISYVGDASTSTVLSRTSGKGSLLASIFQGKGSGNKMLFAESHGDKKEDLEKYAENNSIVYVNGKAVDNIGKGSRGDYSYPTQSGYDMRNDKSLKANSRNSRTIYGEIDINKVTAKGSSIGARANAKAIQRIFSHDSISSDYRAKGSFSALNAARGTGTNATAYINTIYKNAKDAAIKEHYSGGSSGYAEYYDPETGNYYDGEGSLIEEYTGGASKKKKVSTKAKKNYKSIKKNSKDSITNVSGVSSLSKDREFVTLRYILATLKAIQKNSDRSKQIVSLLEEIAKSSGGSKKKKKGKGSELNLEDLIGSGSRIYTGKAAQQRQASESTINTLQQLKQVQNMAAKGSDEDDDLTELINELTKITME